MTRRLISNTRRKNSIKFELWRWREKKKHNPSHCLRAKIKSVDKTRNKNFNFLFLLLSQTRKISGVYDAITFYIKSTDNFWIQIIRETFYVWCKTSPFYVSPLVIVINNFAIKTGWHADIFTQKFCAQKRYILWKKKTWTLYETATKHFINVKYTRIKLNHFYVTTIMLFKHSADNNSPA